MDGHLAKPIRPPDLYAIVDACSPPGGGTGN
jgi:hypothetical protein